MKEPEEQACKKARTLKLQVSDVSVDSHGWPAILNSPKAAKEEEEVKRLLFQKHDNSGKNEGKLQGAAG